MAQVVLESLTKRFGDVVAVDQIDLEIRDKELLVLVGPSGCGKSTTLRMIAGLEQITAGTVTIGDRVVNNIAPKDRNIAMVFQNYALYPHMNVQQNMGFGLKMRKLPKAEINDRIQRAAGILGISELLQRKPAQLSGGERQRVAVGRAIVRDPEVFLFDEPLSNLDAKLRVVMRSELVKLHQRLETTMIYVTHDQVEAMTMGDRIVVMHDGRIQQVDTPLTVYESPANRFVAEFIGSPPMNFFPATVVANEGRLELKSAEFQLAVPDDWTDRYQDSIQKSVIVGIRPEDVATAIPNDRPGIWSRVQATVGVTQLLGADSILELTCGDHKLVARINSHQSHKTGETIDVFLNMSRCHVFDKSSECVI